MLGSPAEHAIKTIEYLNANNVILSKTNAQLLAITRARQQAKKGKRIISKARLPSKDNADKLRAEIGAKKAADIAHKIAISRKKKEQALKKAQEEVEKAERAHQRAVAKDIRDTSAEIARMARVNKRLFT
jgi:hypothetical protein